MMETRDVEQWAESYRRAWENADSDAAAALFSESATYRNDIYQEPNRGRDGVAGYWTSVTSAQEDVTVRMGRPYVDGDRAVVEFWTNMTADGSPLTLGGALLLHFDESGLCESLHEFYAFSEGSAEPPPEWGT
jgi:ketosteroid isomerase-like protein